MKPESLAALNIDPKSAEWMERSLELIEVKFAAAVNGSLAITRLERPAFAAPLMEVLDGIADRLGKPGVDAERIKWAFEREATSSRAEFKLAFAAEATLYLYWSWSVEVRVDKSGSQKLTLRPEARVEVGSSGTSRTPAAALALADLLRESATIGERVRMMAGDLYISASLPAATIA